MTPQRVTVSVGHDAATRRERASAVPVSARRGHDLTVAEHSALLDCYATPDRTFLEIATTHGVGTGPISTQPVRLRLSRRQGFNLQALSKSVNGLEAVHVGRPGPWGNPFVGKHGDAVYCVDLYTALLAGLLRVGADPDVEALERTRRFVTENVEELRGKNLACWCKPGAPCHADVLLEVANRHGASR